LRFGEEPRPAWDVAVLSFRGDGGTQALVSKLDARPLTRKVLYGLEVSLDRPVVYEADVARRRIVLVTQCLWGGPQTAILVEELAALGVHEIIGFGVAGSLTDALPKGTQIVAESGLTTDGTSRAYTDAAEAMVDAALAATLVATATRLNIPLMPVKIATVDALYRETPSDVHRWVGLGAHAINMETTPLYAAAPMCGVRAVWVGHISDRLSRTTEAWDSWQRPAAMTDETVALTIGFLEQIGITR
jgi:uridine phosphorylase